MGKNERVHSRMAKWWILALGMLLSGLCNQGCVTKPSSAPATTSEVESLRGSLDQIVSAKNDDEFVAGLYAFLSEYGVLPLLRHGDLAPIAHAYALSMRESIERDRWVMSDPEGESILLPSGTFMRFLFEGGLTNGVPETADLTETFILVGRGEKLIILDIRDGTMQQTERTPINSP